MRPNASRLLFILPPSIYLMPLLSEAAALSLPARSIIDNFEYLTIFC